MKTFVNPLLGVAVACGVSAAPAAGQIIWSGYDFAFEKADFADFTLAENQDRITDDVWITRAGVQGIFNIAAETGYDLGSPSGTQWAFGRAADWSSLVFDDWQDTISSQPPLMVGQEMVMHLVDDDIYVDVMFTSWTSGAAGGGFAYVRGVPAPSVAGVFAVAGLGLAGRRRG